MNGVDIDTLGASECRKLIREQGLHIRLGIPGVVVSLLKTEHARALLKGEDIDMSEYMNREEEAEMSKTVEVKPAKETAGREGQEAVAGALEALQRALFNPEALKKELLSEIGAHGEALKEQLESRILEVIEKKVPRTIKYEIKASGKKIEAEGVQHYKFPLILTCLSAEGVNLALVGPAGSGKSRVVQECAKALKLEFSPMSFNSLTSKADILGFVDAHGVYHASPFRERFEKGGIFLADEFDASHPGIATILNAAIANRLCTFADGKTIEAHKDFKAVCAMNTWGLGANAEYVGRNRLDAATLDRFAFLEFDYDSDLERGMLGLPITGKKLEVGKGKPPMPDQWLMVVERFRQVTKELNIRAITSPRASLIGCQLAGVGVGIYWLIQMLLLKGLDETQRKAVSGKMREMASRAPSSAPQISFREEGDRSIAAGDDLPF